MSTASLRGPLSSGLRLARLSLISAAFLSVAFLCAPVVLSGCAEELPGSVPPDDQLHFPIGLKLVTVGDNELLIIGSSNFDQRFNAGRLFAMSVPTLRRIVRTATSALPSGSQDVVFPESFENAITGSVRVDSFSGDLEVLMLDPSNTGTAAPYILSPSRGRDELTVVRLAPNGVLSCTLPGSPRRVGLDCTDSHRLPLQARDPFPLGVTQVGGQSVVAVGGLQAANPVAGIFEGTVSFMTSRYLEDRLSGRLPALSSIDDCNVFDNFLISVRGVSGFVPLPATSSSTSGPARMMSVSFRSAPNLGFDRYDINLLRPPDVCGDPLDLTLDIQTSSDFRFDLAFSAFETRGVVINREGTRAYATARISDSVDTTNSVLGVFDITGDTVRLLDAQRFGEEFGRPFLDERPNGAKLLYIGDQRFDLIYVIDVTSDEAEFVTRIESRGLRNFGDRTLQVRLLDQPAQIVFTQEGGRRLAFVSNFSNSTLAVLDIMNPDPRRHRVVARMGRDLDPQGQREGE